MNKLNRKSEILMFKLTMKYCKQFKNIKYQKGIKKDWHNK